MATNTTYEPFESDKSEEDITTEIVTKTRQLKERHKNPAPTHPEVQSTVDYYASVIGGTDEEGGANVVAQTLAITADNYKSLLLKAIGENGIKKVMESEDVRLRKLYSLFDPEPVSPEVLARGELALFPTDPNVEPGEVATPFTGEDVQNLFLKEPLFKESVKRNIALRKLQSREEGIRGAIDEFGGEGSDSIMSLGEGDRTGQQEIFLAATMDGMDDAELVEIIVDDFNLTQIGMRSLQLMLELDPDGTRPEAWKEIGPNGYRQVDAITPINFEEEIFKVLALYGMGGGMVFGAAGALLRGRAVGTAATRMASFTAKSATTFFAVDRGIHAVHDYLVDKEEYSQLQAMFGELGLLALYGLTSTGLNHYIKQKIARDTDARWAELWSKTFKTNTKNQMVARINKIIRESSPVGIKKAAKIEPLALGAPKGKAVMEAPLAGSLKPTVDVKINEGVHMRGDQGAVDDLDTLFSLAIHEVNSPVGKLAADILKVNKFAPYIPQWMLPEATEILLFQKMAGSDIGQLVDNLKGYAVSYGPQIAYAELAKKQAKTSDFITTHFYPNNTWDNTETFFTPGVGVVGVKNKVQKYVNFQHRVLKEFADTSRRLFRSAQFESARMNLAMQKHSRELAEGLTSKQVDELNKALAVGDELGMELPVIGVGLRPDQFTVPITTDREVIDAYYSFRMLNNQNYFLLNQTQNRMLRKEGVKLYTGSAEGEVLVKRVNDVVGRKDYTGKIYTAEMKDQGWETYGDGDRDNVFYMVPPEKTKSLVSDIPEHYRGTPFLDGQVPRLYEGKVGLAEISFDLATEKYVNKTISAGDTVRQVNAAIAEMPEVPGVYRFAYRFGKGGGSISESKSTAAMWKALGSEGRDKLLSDLAGDPGNTDLLSVLAKLSDIKHPVGHNRAMKRGPRLKALSGEGNAPIKPATDSIMQTASGMVDYSTKAALFRQAKEQFMAEYADVLKYPGDWQRLKTLQELQDAIPGRKLPVGMRAELEARLAEAKLYRDHLENVLNRPTAFEEKEADFFGVLTDKMYNSKAMDKLTVNKAIDKVVFNLLSNANLKSVSKGLRHIGAVELIQLFSIGQLPMQATQIFNIAGLATSSKLGPIHAAQGLKDAATVLYYLRPSRLAKVMPTTKRMEFLYDILQKSGFISELNIDDVHHMYNASFGRRALAKKMWNAQGVFFKEGESVARVAILFGEHNKLVHEIRKGTSKFTPEQLYTPEFYQELRERTSVLALDLSRANKPKAFRIASGTPEVRFQFVPWAFGQAEAMMSTTTDWKQKIGLYTMWGSMFGMGGIPFLDDVGQGIEMSLEASGHPEAIGAIYRNVGESVAPAIADYFGADTLFVKRYLTKGLGNALSDGNVDAAHRGGIQLVFDQFAYAKTPLQLLAGPAINNIWAHAVDLVGWVPSSVAETAEYLQANFESIDPEGDDLLDRATRYTARMRGRGGLLELARIAQHFEEGDSWLQFITPAKTLARKTPGLSNPLKAVEGVLRGKFTDSGGKTLINDPTLSEILMQASSFPPGSVTRIYEARSRLKRIKDAWREYKWAKAGELAKLASVAPDVGLARFNDLLREIEVVNPQLAGEFMSAFINSSLFHSYPVGDRLQMQVDFETSIPENQRNWISRGLKGE